MWVETDLVVNIKKVPDILVYALQLPWPQCPGCEVLGVHLRAALRHGVRTMGVLVVPSRVPPGLSAPNSFVNI